MELSELYYTSNYNDNLGMCFNDDYKNIINNIPNNTIDMILCDPPYLHVKGGMKSKKFNTGTWKADSYTNTSMNDFGENEIYDFLNSVKPKMKKINMYIFCSKLQLQYYFKWIYDNKLKYDLLIWDKKKKSMKSTKFFTSDIDYVVKIYESGVSLNKIMLPDNTKADSDYYTKIQAYEQPKGKHETMKPIELLKKYILLSSNENDIILDPFMGSGSTCIAAKILNRKYIGIEINEEYFNLAINRINGINND